MEGLVSTSAAEGDGRAGRGSSGMAQPLWSQLWHQPSPPAFAPAQHITAIYGIAEACGMGEEKRSQAHLTRLRELIAP